jgi:membrane protease YdiL (CAAX protease family)
MRSHPSPPGLALCAIGAAAGLATCGFGAARPASDAVGLGVSSLGLELTLACIALAGALVSRRALAERLGLGPGRLSARALASLALGTLALSHGLDALLELSGLRERSALADLERSLADASGAGLWLALLGIGLAPAVGEELLCRGLVQRGLEPRLGGGRAVALGALVFGALHLEPVHALFASLLGLYLGTVALLAGSIRAAILCHAFNNLVAVGAAALWPGADGAGAASVVAGFAVAWLCLAAARRSLATPAAPAAGNPLPGLQPGAGSDEG